MLVWKLGPVLANGCVTAIKPAEQAPLSTLYIGHLIIEANIVHDVANILPGYGPTTGAALVNHSDAHKIAFTGSTEIGKLIAKQSAGTLKRITLELGGKLPNIVSLLKFLGL